MHQEVLDFVGRVKGYLPQFFVRGKVLEIGSYNINGSIRQFFSGVEYVGVDWRAGPGVDEEFRGHEIPYPANAFDVVASTECLEHDPHWASTLTKMVEVCKPGGLLLMTVASLDRAPHEIDCAPGRHYLNLQREHLLPYMRNVVLYEENHISQGIHAAWRKDG